MDFALTLTLALSRVRQRRISLRLKRERQIHNVGSKIYFGSTLTATGKGPRARKVDGYSLPFRYRSARDQGTLLWLSFVGFDRSIW